MNTQPAPLYLLADSQLLFRKNAQGQAALHSIWSSLQTKQPLAAYIGASNGDVPDFFDLFCEGMRGLDITRCVHIKAQFTPADRQALQAADLILLAGGDPLLGWEILQNTGMRSILENKYQMGAILLGTSAGAIQLSQQWFDETKQQYQPMMQLAPYTIDVHDEANDWQRLRAALPFSTNPNPVRGIQSGAGMIYHPQQRLQVIGPKLVVFE